MTVRARTTLAATIVVGLALLLAGVGLLVTQRRTLVANLDEVADLRAAGVAALSADGTLTLATDDDELVRVVDADGRTTAETPGFRDELAVGDVPIGEDAVVRTVDGWRVTVLPTPRGAVYVATGLEPVDESIAALRTSLLVGGPIVLALVALTSWLLIGRALRPVDAITAQVAEISERSLHRRVPVPGTDDEIARLATRMNTMLDRLQAGSEQQQRFVADASHELRTPLAALRADLESSTSDDRREELLATTIRMERLVHDLLYLARADGAPPPTRGAIDLDDIVLEEVTRARHPVDTSQVSGAPVLGNREDLTRVVRNLLDNAIRHARATVRVTLTTDDGDALLSVIDDGPGIPPADRERVFERFTRLDDARARSLGGTGLGLAITREIVLALGGTITVEDARPGARFVVRLPSI